MELIDSNFRNLIFDFFECLKLSRRGSAVIRLLEIRETKVFDGSYIDQLIDAIKENNFDALEQHFTNLNFISSNGLLLLIGPYSVFRFGKAISELTGVFGVVTQLSQTLDNEIETKKSAFEVNDFIVPIIGFRRVSSFGVAGGFSGEAFLVPSSWGFGNCSNGPALNDLTEQYSRVLLAAQCIKKAFTKKSSEILLSAVLDSVRGIDTRHREFLFHERGHASGYGFTRKYEEGFFKKQQKLRGVEEWRSDGISFKLMKDLCAIEDASRLIASTIVLRLGMDIHRSGGIDNDADAIASSLMLQDMLESGKCQIVNSKLHLPIKDINDVFYIINQQQEKAIHLTQSEEKINFKELKNKYDKIQVSNEMKSIINEFLLSPCKNLFDELI